MLRQFLKGLIASLLLTGTVMAIEEPKYEVLRVEGDIELRQYAPRLIAEVSVEGDMDEASSKGFRLIASYIFGNNQAVDQPGSEKISMTAPVTVEPRSEKIAMTAPVTLETGAQELSMQAANVWRVSFVMPVQYSLANIPKPNDPAVKLSELPVKYVVVLTYSGLNTLTKIQALTDQLREWTIAKGFKILGAPQLARYNPPWTLPFFRRNEIMLEISKPG